MAKLAVDTTFLIDLQKERAPERGRVRAFLERHQDDSFLLPLTALGEFAAGFDDLNHEAYLTIRRSFRLLDCDELVALRYRDIFRQLKARGTMVGANDLWIAASAIRHELPLVTRNAHEFARIPQLHVLTY